MAEEVSWHSLPLFVRLEGRAVVLLGEGDAADAKRRILERAGAAIVGEDTDARLAIVAIEDDEAAHAAVARLKARGMLVNAVDRPALCDFTLPAIVDRAPVLIAIGTGGVSAGLAAALRQRLEALLPAGLGRVAEWLHAARDDLRERYPDAAERRRAIADMLAEGGALDPLTDHPHPSTLRVSSLSHREREGAPEARKGEGDDAQIAHIHLSSPDPDDLTLRQARLLANADRVVRLGDVPAAILDRARADAPRLTAMPDAAPGLTVVIEA
jgi:uroporphyrin-III C-methyltransferase/precorrin-2 dehydrogenase/sirohydrochlorin ferrochelatase